MANELRTLLYIGGFKLPDGNAAAQRVVANAKLFQSIGFDVQFLNYSANAECLREANYFGFKCIEFPEKDWKKARSNPSDFFTLMKSGLLPNLWGVIAYNYPSISFMKIMSFCRKVGIRCIADVTEWYSSKDVKPMLRPLKWADTTLRMRVLHKQCSGIICISDYLARYYRHSNRVLQLPPLIDRNDKKWEGGELADIEGPCNIVYAGSPTKSKERLDLIVEALAHYLKDKRIVLNVYGLTEEQFRQVYPRTLIPETGVVFHGRVAHEVAIEAVKQANYTIIVRDKTRVNIAGFPTKFVESVTSGTPVICNQNSDLEKYVERYACGVIVDEACLSDGIGRALDWYQAFNFDRWVFDFRKYAPQARAFFQSI